MKTETYTLEFLTPCFCAGANQSVAEIRPSAIRGQLRWWFRALGGTHEQEREVFGGIAKKPEDIRASSVVVRISDVKPGPAWHPPGINPNAPESYVWYYASASGKAKGQRGDGPRWNAGAALAPGTACKMTVLHRHNVQSEIFEKSLRCFLALGSIGLRATRGLGAFDCPSQPFDTEIEQILAHAGFQFVRRKETFADLNHIVREIGALVKGTRKALGMRFDAPSPFGSSSPRQTSAVWFRPLRVGGSFGLAVFDAPHGRVLGEESHRSTPILPSLQHPLPNR
jgi:CRISPR type III-B/RAMP module RAMP protein Cmr1